MCGIVGAFGVDKVTYTLGDMMIALQYRGEQSCGLFLANEKNEFCGDKAAGPIIELFKKINVLAKENKFTAGIGHLRYGTSGSRDALKNAQPLYAQMPWGEIYLAHNGDMPNFNVERRLVLKNGATLSTDSDSELILKYIGLAREKSSIESVMHGLALYEGTYALVMLIKDQDGTKLIAARDPSGNRPLSLGSLGKGYVVASENSAFEATGSAFIRDIEPGEMLIISENGFSAHLLHSQKISKRYHCVFENIYFAFPGSKVFGMPVWKFRWLLGKKAAKKFSNLVENDDIITYVPDSGKFFALGFANALNRPLGEVLIRRHSADFIRSFTQASQNLRQETLRKKFSLVGELVHNKRVWVGEDSIVRGNTSRKIASALKGLGAKWVGFLSSAPPIIGPCRKGIDFEENLIAAKHNSNGSVDVEKIKNEIGVDFLGYLDIPEIESVIGELGQKPNDFCFGCFQNKEPIFGIW